MNKYLAILICAVMISLTIGYVSAFEFDNTKDYDEETRTITIKNSFLWMFDLGDVATITLNSELVEYVGSGEDVKVAEFTINNYAENYPRFLKKLDLFDTKKGNKKLKRDLIYKYRVLTGTREIRSSWGCGPESLKGCVPNTESYDLNEYEWVDFNKEKDLPKGEITIGVFTEVIDGDRVEWIPELFGVEIDEWAIWTSGISLDLTHYYNMDGLPATVGAINLQTKSGVPVFNNSNCIFVDCVNIVTSNNVQTNSSNVDFNLKHRNNSLNVWVYPMGNTDGSLFSSSADAIWGIYHYKATGIINFNWGDAGCTDFNGGGILFPVDELHMLTIANNGSDLLFYKDGVFGGNCQQVNDNTAMTLNIGERHDGTWTWNGAVDELATWNRTITPSEITRLYNSGTGINYTATPFYEINITLRDQVNGSVISTKNATLNCSASSIGDVMNLSLIIGNVINKTVTNVTTNDTLNIEEIENFPDGLANWTCKASSLQYEEVPLKLRYFQVDAEAPVLNVLDPNNTFRYLSYEGIEMNWTVFDLTGLDLCWYEYGGENITTDCGTNLTTLNTTEFNQSLIFYANDTGGKVSFEEISWRSNLFGVNESYSATGTEGTTSSFVLLGNVSNTCTINSANLVYNNTLYPATIVSLGGDRFNFTRTIDVPNTIVAVNNSFWWNVIYSDCDESNSTLHNQTVYIIGLDDCSANPNEVINMTIFDEEDLELLGGATHNTNIEVELIIKTLSGVNVVNYSNNFTDDNPARICVSADLTGSYRMDSTIRYSANGRETELYHIQNFTLTNDTLEQRIGLYDLISNDSQVFEIIYKDANFIPVGDALIQIQRRYISEGIFRTVEIPKTDALGRTIGHFDLDSIIYTLVITKFGQVLATFDNVAVVCQDQVLDNCVINLNSFSSEIPSTDWDTESGLSYTFDLDEDARTITSVFTTTSGASSEIVLNTTKYDRFGNQTICLDTLTSSSGTLTCNIPTSFGNVTMISKIFKDGQLVTTKTFVITPDASDYFGADGYILVLLLMISIPLMLTTSTIGVVVGVMIGFIMAVSLMLLKSNTIVGVGSSIIWVIIAGGIIIWKISKKD